MSFKVVTLQLCNTVRAVREPPLPAVLQSGRVTTFVLCAMFVCSCYAAASAVETKPASPVKVPPVDAAWSSWCSWGSLRKDTFAREIRSSVEAIVSANESENPDALLERVSELYRGAQTFGGILSRIDIENALRCDYEIFDSLHYSARTETVRMTRGSRGVRQAEVILLWTARARLHSTGQEVVETGRRTRFIFVEEPGLVGRALARVIYQSGNGLRNGTVLFGRADPQACAIRLKVDAGSQTGAGTFLLSGTSASGGETVTPTK